MAASDLYEVTFEWPHTEPTTVIVTGTFDEWSSSVHLTKTSTGFVGSTKIPWGDKIKFKFVVDGKWLLHENQITETDPGGFVNHVFTAPPAPPVPSTEELSSTALIPETAEATDSAEPVTNDEAPTNGQAGNGNVAIAEQVEKSADVAVQPPAAEAADDDVENADSELKATTVYPAGYPQFLTDIADTIVARDGTSSTLGYVASGIGAAIHSVVGVDPINIQQIAIPTPKVDDAFTVPGGTESVPNSAVLPGEPVSTPPAVLEVPQSLPSPVAPRVPILIVPVNAAENNTLPPPELEPVVPPTIVSKFTPPAEMAAPAAVAPAEEVVVEEPIPSKADDVIESVPAAEAIAVSEHEPVAELKVEDERRVQLAAVEEPTVEPEAEEVVAPEFAPAPAVEEPVAETPAETLAVDNFVTEIKAEAVVLQADDALAHIPSADAPEAEQLGTPAVDEHAVKEVSVSDPIIQQSTVEVPVEVTEEVPEAVVTTIVTDEPAAKEETALIPDSVVAPVVQEEEIAAPVPSNAEVTDESKEVKPEAHLPAAKEPSATIKDGTAEAATTTEPAPESVAESTPATITAEPPVAILEKKILEPTAIAEAPKPVEKAEIVESPPAIAEVSTPPPPAEPTPAVVESTPVEPAAPAASSIAPPIPIASAESTDSTKPSSNGHAAPATPSKEKKAFPSTESPSADNSPSSSKFNSMRKKRTSIFGKIKNIFHADKEEKEKK